MVKCHVIWHHIKSENEQEVSQNTRNFPFLEKCVMLRDSISGDSRLKKVVVYLILSLMEGIIVCECGGCTLIGCQAVPVSYVLNLSIL